MVDLRDNSGLDLKLDIERPRLIFGEDIKFSTPAVRTIDQMKEVLLDKDIREPVELYYMYRDIHKTTDSPILKEHKLRFDVTVIKSSHLGREFMKTAGHYHPGSFGELYEVVFGRCLCLLQRPDSEDYRVIKEVILVEAVQGQKIVIPPGFGHILINPGPDCLVTSNWVSGCFSSSYELYREAKGAAYFVILPDNTSEGMTTPGLKIKINIIKNQQFKELARIKFAKPAGEIKRFSLMENNPIYNIINRNAQALNFLNHPLDYEYNDIFIYTDT